MNARLQFFLVTTILIALSACNSLQKESKTENKTYPYQQMMFQRSYPDNTIDLDEVNKVYQAHQELVSQRSSSSNGTWRLEGPTNIGGRLNTVAIHPIDDNIILTGCSTGGIFRTGDGGNTWEAVSDNFDYLPIGDIVFDPIDPSIVYAGTGDPNITQLPHPGNGIYKSTDTGLTWEHLGLDDPTIVAEVLIDYNNNDIIYAATMGLPYEPNPDRGLYKSEDGGNTWDQILFVDEDAGIIDLVMDPQNSDVIYAASWNRIRNNNESLVYENDSKIFKTSNGGDTWIELSNGLPGTDQCRIGIDISQQNPNKLYAVYVGQDYQVEGVYKTENGGNTWTDQGNVGLEDALGGFGWYFGKIRVNPLNDNEISVLGVDLWTSNNEGGTWEKTSPEWWTYEVHADKHDLVYYNANEIYVATDGGLYKTPDHFTTWQDIDEIPNTQFYRIALNPHQPGIYTGGAQDNGTTAGAWDGLADWPRLYGGDGFQAIYDPFDETLWYAETQRGNLVFYDGSWESFTNGIENSDRRAWDMPYIMSHFNNQVFYTGTYRMYKMDDAPYGEWYPISEDLTDGDLLGGSFNTISTVAESKMNSSVLYAGTSDGYVWSSLNDGDTWNNITGTLPDRYVTNIKTSSEDEAVAYVTHNGYKDIDNTSHIHKSFDYGNTWIDVSGDLPEIPVNHIEIMNDTTFFIATDVGVYYTENEGEHWERVGNDMPLIPVFDLEIDLVQNRLVAGTFARSIQTFPLDSLFAPEPVGISELSSAGDYDIYPNPTQGLVQVRTTLYKNVLLEVINMNGVVLYKSKFNGSTEIDLSNLVRGYYFIRFTAGDIISVKKIEKI